MTSPHPGLRVSRLVDLVPLILIPALFVPSLIWVVRDMSVWPWDQAWYGEVSADLYYLLTHQPGAWGAAMLHAFGSKAPGMAWLGQAFVPIGQIIGRVETGLLFSILIFQAGTMWLIYSIGRRLAPDQPLVAIAGIVFAASAPLFIGLSHQYFVEPMQTLAVTLFFYLALIAPRLSRTRLLAGLIGATAAGMLAKSSTPMYAILPGLVATTVLVLPESQAAERPTGRSAAWVPLTFAGFALLAAVVWYAINLRGVLHKAYFSAVGEIALDYGRRDAFLNKLDTWLAALQVGFGLPRVLLLSGIAFAGGLVYAFIRWRRTARAQSPNPAATPQAWQEHAHIVLGCAVLQIVGVLTILSLSINEEPRFLLPVLPALAIVLMWGLSRIRMTAVSALITVVFGIQYAVIHAQAHGMIAPRPDISHWVRPVETGPADYHRLQRAVELTCTDDTNLRYTVIGVEFPAFNANSASFFSAKNRLRSGRRCYYISMGYAETDFDRALNRIFDMRTAFFVSLAEEWQTEPPNFLNVLSIPMLHFIETSPEFETEVNDPVTGLLIFRNLRE